MTALVMLVAVRMVFILVNTLEHGMLFVKLNDISITKFTNVMFYAITRLWFVYFDSNVGSPEICAIHCIMYEIANLM